MKNNINQLRNHLFDVLQGLKDDSMTVEKAKAISDVAQTIINSAKVEVDYVKTTGAKESSFLDGMHIADQEVSELKNNKLPKGITGITRHLIKG
jgi:hypothetical protein